MYYTAHKIQWSKTQNLDNGSLVQMIEYIKEQLLYITVKKKADI